jgi:hypothetical protein
MEGVAPAFLYGRGPFNVDAEPRVRADGRKRASRACGALLATLVGRRSTRALGVVEVISGDERCEPRGHHRPVRRDRYR